MSTEADGDCADTRRRLNVRGGIEIRECSSFDQAVLWCYRHDFGALGVGPDTRSDPYFEARLGFALPHLEDYLRLILKQPEAFDIPAYARTLHARMIAESERIEHHATGAMIFGKWLDFAARFQSADFDPSLRARQVSIYPFPPFRIDLENLVSHPPTLRDPRCEYLAEEFRRYFPLVSQRAASVTYASYDDEMYKLHVRSVHEAMEGFAYSNSAIPSSSKPKWSRLFNWVGWATLLVRPRIAREETKAGRALSDIALTFPSGPTEAETLRMLDAYRNDNPEMYKRWIDIETSPITDERNALKEVQSHGVNYLKYVCVYEEYTAVVNGWAKMRSKLHDQLRDQGAFGR